MIAAEILDDLTLQAIVGEQSARQATGRRRGQLPHDRPRAIGVLRLQDRGDLVQTNTWQQSRRIDPHGADLGGEGLLQRSMQQLWLSALGLLN